MGNDGMAHCHLASDGDSVGLDGRLLSNPGSVGQPRDGDPRASYAILDQDESTISFHRIPYDVRGAAAAILRVGLPEELARRLHAGY
jgi:diadenosine tetraphosphatase ApaH/serine/threonine PP2A family protein phosphatase